MTTLKGKWSTDSFKCLNRNLPSNRKINHPKCNISDSLCKHFNTDSAISYVIVELNVFRINHIAYIIFKNFLTIIQEIQFEYLKDFNHFYISCIFLK